MTEWSCDIRTEWPRLLLRASGLFMLAIGFLAGNTILIAIGSALFLLSLTARYVLRQLLNGLYFDNKDEKYRSSSGDSDQLVLTFFNRSPFPMTRVTVRLIVDPLVRFHDASAAQSGELTVCLSLPARSLRRVTLPYTAARRGIARIRSLHLSFSDPFSLCRLRCRYNPFIKKQMIVYPQLESIALPVIQKQQLFGFEAANQSLFTDFSAPIGIRDYQPVDTFRMIHWKASARLGTLQTKTFMKIAAIHWTFLLLNPENDYLTKKDAHFEQRLSCAAWLMRLACKQNIRYTLLSNTKPFGHAITQIDTDQGLRQLHLAYEYLAFVQRWEVRTAPRQALLAMSRCLEPASTVFVIGDQDSLSMEPMFRRWRTQGHAIFFLDFSTPVARLTAFHLDERSGS
ncbi:MAG: DUF58 domain-containing protein [Sporolactobacillus sp.]